jgi:hypothetical protein
VNDDLGHLIPLPDGIDYVQAFHHPSKAGMVTVEVRRVFAAVANEKLRTARITSGVSHGKHAPVVVLITAGEFAVDFITGSAGTRTGRITALYDEVGDYPVKGEAVVEAFFGQRNKILNGFGRIGIEELDFHHPFIGMDFAGCHGRNFCKYGRVSQSGQNSVADCGIKPGCSGVRARIQDLTEAEKPASCEPFLFGFGYITLKDRRKIRQHKSTPQQPPPRILGVA